MLKNIIIFTAGAISGLLGATYLYGKQAGEAEARKAMADGSEASSENTNANTSRTDDNETPTSFADDTATAN